MSVSQLGTPCDGHVGHPAPHFQKVGANIYTWTDSAQSPTPEQEIADLRRQLADTKKRLDDANESNATWEKRHSEKVAQLAAAQQTREYENAAFNVQQQTLKDVFQRLDQAKAQRNRANELLRRALAALESEDGQLNDDVHAAITEHLEPKKDTTT